MWTILFDEDFAAWLDGLSDAERNPILAHAGLLREHGPNLGRPRVDTLKGSRIGNLKELRVQIAGAPWRVLFAFDPRRSAILLVGGCKQGHKRWYEINIPLAEARYQRHLERLAKEE